MKTPFKLKYKNSAFPFKGSPVKKLQTKSGESVVEVDGEGSNAEDVNIETAKKTLQTQPGFDFHNMGKKSANSIKPEVPYGFRLAGAWQKKPKNT